MTLIVTTISDLGILQMSDSNLTNKDGSFAGTGRKVYPLGFCPGALAVAGSYDINGVGMDVWIPSVLTDYASSPSADLEGFAGHLRERIMAEQELGETALMVHIAGYASDQSGSRPEMWFVRNFGGIDGTTGEYIDRSDDFTVSEDFWKRDYPGHHAAGDRPPSGLLLQWYFNGLPEGRINFVILNDLYWRFLESSWANPTWGLRPPDEISQLAEVMKHELGVIGTMFDISGLHYIGGDIQVEEVRRPADAVIL